MPSKEIDFSEVLTKEAIKKVNKGQTMGFQQPDGSIQHYKITRLNKPQGIIRAVKINLYTEDEINAMGRKKAEAIIKNGSEES